MAADLEARRVGDAPKHEVATRGEQVLALLGEHLLQFGHALAPQLLGFKILHLRYSAATASTVSGVPASATAVVTSSASMSRFVTNLHLIGIL